MGDTCVLVSPAKDPIPVEMPLTDVDRAVFFTTRRGTKQWRRAFPVTDLREVIQISFNGMFLVAASDPEEEKALFSERDKYAGLLNCACGIAARGRHCDIVEYSTWTPLTPPIEGFGSVYVGARHALSWEAQPSLTWSLTARFDDGPELVRYGDLEVLHFRYPRELTDARADLLPDTAEPTPLLGYHPDLLFLKVPPGKDRGNGAFFVPNPCLAVGDMVDVLEYVPRPTVSEAISVVGAEDTEDSQVGIGDEERLAAADLVAQWSDAMSFHRRSVAPGTVNFLNDRFVAYTVSAVPGSSGSRGGRLGRPQEIGFVHLRGRDGRNHNLGMRVTHPAFAFVYIRNVLPLVTRVALSTSQAESIHEFIRDQSALVAKYHLEAAVNSFRSAHPEPHRT
eukprot:m51a1_g9083 hypothetical protein (394) ;mRNA; f:30824-32213